MPAKNLRRTNEGGAYCHVYNKGIEGRSIFADDSDYQVFLSYLEEYLSTPKALDATKKEFTVNGRIFRGVPHQPKNYFNKVGLIAYSLSPDHFHLVLHQKAKKSLQAFIRSLCTRYSIYFNKKYSRTGTLFEGPYKSVQITDNNGLLLLTKHLHKTGFYSTLAEYSGQKVTPWVESKVVLSMKNTEGNYYDYLEKYEPNQSEKTLLQTISIEDVDNHLERRNLEEIVLKPWSRIPELAAAGAVLVLLLGFSLRNVSLTRNVDPPPKTLGTTSTLASPQPTESPINKSLEASESANTQNNIENGTKKSEKQPND